jgi:hypothetical protein
VAPAAGKSFEAFGADDAVCREWASRKTGITPQQAAGTSTAEGAAIGALLGAGQGAAIGAAAGDAGIGAAVGAGGGLLAGTAIGANAGQTSAYEVQRRYDVAYEQCMYARGTRVPAAGAPTHLGVPPPPSPAPLAGPGVPPGPIAVP